MGIRLWPGALVAVCLGGSAAAQARPAATAPFPEQLGYLLGQAAGGFRELRGDSIVGVFALTLAAPGDSSAFKHYREMISAALPAWQNHSPGGGDWTECADPRRGRELILSSGRTAAGQLLLTLSITVHPDATCS